MNGSVCVRGYSDNGNVEHSVTWSGVRKFCMMTFHGTLTDWSVHLRSGLACVACVMVGRWFKHVAFYVLHSDGDLLGESHLLRCTVGWKCGI